MSVEVPSGLLPITEQLRDEIRTMRFGGSVRHVYNPLEYAWVAHGEYLRRFARGPVETLLVGMNAGYFGMAQTGVPFGDVVMVRDWIGIEADVAHPPDEHPKRPIQGFACHRREVSGQRLWGWARDAFGTPESFFERFFVLNYCPLCFLSESGANLALDKLPVTSRKALQEACDRALRSAAEALKARYAIGIGNFAADRIPACSDRQLSAEVRRTRALPIRERGRTGADKWNIRSHRWGSQPAPKRRPTQRSPPPRSRAQINCRDSAPACRSSRRCSR
jgi:single-strand selective monofunctional uracil DNA glycosylase